MSCDCYNPHPYGCRACRQRDTWTGYDTRPAYETRPVLQGCVCPAGSEATCQGLACPRRNPFQLVQTTPQL